jgi:aerobic carbon-monoxide dehydrogenase medium subunit
MIPSAFDYVRASSLADAIGRAQGDPDASKFIAGGHTLLPTLKLRLASPSLLIDIGGITDLRGIEIGDASVRIGALTTHAELLGCEPLHAALPIFRQAAGMIADPQVRNRGTIGGSLANADPAADWPAVVVALKADIEIAGVTGSRRVPAQDFFVDIFATRLGPGELLTAIHITRPKPDARFGYRKIRHPASGYAVVGVAACVRIKDGIVAEISVGVTGAASHAFAAKTAADFLTGKPLSRLNIDKAALLASESVECLADHYTSAEYRKHLVKTEIARALFALAS